MSADELARELGGIEAACRRLGRKDGLDAARPVCLYRRVGGLSVEAWRQLKQELELDAWDVATPEVLVTGPGSRLRRLLHREIDRAKQCQLPLALAFIEPDASDAASASSSISPPRVQLIRIAAWGIRAMAEASIRWRVSGVRGPCSDSTLAQAITSSRDRGVIPAARI